MNAPTHLSTLAAAWLQAKADEDAAKARRYEIEAQIVAAMPVKEEGTAKADDAGLRISVTHKLIRKADTLALRQHWNDLSKPAQDCFKWEAALALTELRRADPATVQELAPYITTSPAKPAVKVEPIEADT